MIHVAFTLCWGFGLACTAWLIHTDHPVWAFCILICTASLQFTKVKDGQ